MKKVVFLLIASLFLVITACNKERIEKVNPDDITVNLNKAELQQRIELLNYQVTLNSFKADALDPDPTPAPELWAVVQIIPAQVTFTNYNWEHPTDPTITRITATNIAPLLGDVFLVAADPATTDYAGQTLSMTGVETAANNGHKYAYFTSHIRDGVYGGEIFVVRYDDDDTDLLEAEVSIFDNTADYNDLTIESNSTLWVAGDNNARGAIVRYVTLDELHALYELGSDEDQATDFTMTKYNMPLLGPSGNSVTIFNDQLWVVAGGHNYGALAVMDRNDDSQLFARTDVTHAKHFHMANTSNGMGYYGAFLYGDGNYDNDNANLRVFNTANGPFSYDSYTVAADVTEWGKNAINVDEDALGDFYVYLAMGADGIVKVDASTGLTVDSYNGLDTYGGNGLANGLVVHGEYLYVAWGASGLVIFDKNDLSTPVGQWNGIGSCNYVAVDVADPLKTPVPSTPEMNDLLWVGNGVGGMIMLKFVEL